MKLNFKHPLLLAGLTAIFSFNACNPSGQPDETKASTDSMRTTKHHDNTYVCPMHPEITGKKGDDCSKCGMSLEPSATDESAEKHKLNFRTSTEEIFENKPVDLIFTPENLNKKEESVALEVVHEKKIHLIITSEDLSWFDHIHPEYQADGSYKVAESFPGGGKYFLFADYKPVNGKSMVEKIEINVKGKKAKKVEYSAANINCTTDGYDVKFINGNEMQSGIESHILIQIEKNKKPIDKKELELYLGANAHIVMIGLDEKQYLHVHPEADDFPIHAHTIIKKPGIYRMWVQFQTHGKIHTANFVVNVKEGKGNASSPHHHEEHGVN